MIFGANYPRKIAAWLFTVFCMAVLITGNVTAFADFPALDSTGSISVTIKDRNTGDPVPGGVLKYYQVAGIKGDGVYRYDLTGDFSSFQEPITNETPLNEDLAMKLAAFASQNSAEGTAVTIGEDGKASVKDLALGLYLIVQTEPAPGHVKIDPFLVSVPYRTKADTWVLDVDATPKPGLAKECEPLKVSLTAEKKITGEKVPSTTFRFVFKRLGSSPMPVNEKGLVSAGGPVVESSADKMTVQIKGAGTVTIGEITFDQAGDYYYLCSEENTGEKDFTYDKTVYWCRIRVEQVEDALEISEIVLKKGGAEGTAVYTGTDASKALFTFTNAYKTTTPTTPTPSTPKLPQTGQLWWPVLVLGLAGIVLLFFGALLRRKTR